VRHRIFAVLAIAALALACTAAAPPNSWHPRSIVDLTPPGEPGEPLVVTGLVVSNLDGAPLANVHLHLYQQDAHGHYSNRPDGPNRLAGDIVSAPNGGYVIHTIVPGLAEGSPHIHCQALGTVMQPVLPITISFCRTHGAGSDTVFERLPYFASVPKSNPTGYWARVERAANIGFVCYFNLPVPAQLGTRVK
jgi:hypothetical protein